MPFFTLKPFPTEHLSPILRDYSMELAGFLNIPVEVPANLALVTTGAAIGNTARLYGTIGAEVHGANLHLAVGAANDCHIESLLSRICSPVTLEQTRDFQGFNSLSEEQLMQQVARIESEKAAFFKNDAFPDPEHAAHFDDQIHALKIKARPVILMEDHALGQLLPALYKSFDTAVMAIFRDNVGFAPLVEAVRTGKPPLLLDLLRKSWCQSNFVGAHLEGGFDCPLVEPSLSVIGICQPEPLAELIAGACPATAGVAEQFLVFNAALKPHPLIPSMQGRGVKQQKAWSSHLKRLLSASFIGILSAKHIRPCCI